MNIEKIFNYKLIVCIINLFLISGMFLAVFSNYQTQTNSKEVIFSSKNNIFNKYSDDSKMLIPEKNFFSIDQEFFKSIETDIRKKIFKKNGELVGIKLYENEDDNFPIVFEEYNEKNFITQITKYNKENGFKLYTIKYIYDKSKVINKIKEIYNDLQKISQIEIYNVNYSCDKSNDYLSKVTKYNDFNSILYTVDYIYNKLQKVSRINKDIYNDSGKRLFTEIYHIIDGSEMPVLIKKIRYSLKNGIIESIFHYFNAKDNKKKIVKQFFVGGILDKTITEETDLLANKKTKIVYQDRNDEIFKINKYDLNQHMWCSEVYKNKVIVDRRCEDKKDKSNRSYKHYQKLQNKEDLALIDEQFIDEQNNVWNKEYIYKANGELDHVIAKKIYY
ncbi:hypothetical protein [Candidatus Phytoplasma citri]|uniref:Uncharacterized protein n=1 Tax=Candidatus Phytoplasma citri TaxID=180978 RepID=A0A1S9M1P0_9MOLU|nr:hypothetical protein [Candidatus Phytoplasma aurantifolia]MDO8060326.1 hypothetical protein [Candidatus Phytoplasma aurantifolia]MDO8079008.1 hypothetical protein [Candidatus Phytoplasma aurantifolia]OOP59062.1 hypothetical protein B2G44_01240 [Candidatus Phytoplasma aurantifolia]